MSILDYFRKISGAEIYKETCDLIRLYRLKYQVEAVVPTEDPKELERRRKMKRKSFYLDWFANHGMFVQFRYCPVDMNFLPIQTVISRKVEIKLTENGVICEPWDFVVYNYQHKYCLRDWKRDKKKLAKAIEFALDTPDWIHRNWGDWLSGAEDKSVIHYEAAKKPLKLTMKRGPRNSGRTNDA